MEPEAEALAAEGAALGDEVLPEVAVALEEAGEADEEAGRYITSDLSTKDNQECSYLLS